MSPRYDNYAFVGHENYNILTQMTMIEYIRVHQVTN